MRVNFINNSCVWISLSPPLLTFKPPTFSLSSFFLRLKLSGKWGHWNNSITLGADIAAAAASDGGDARKYTHSTVYTKMSLFMRDDGIDDLRWDEGKGKRGERKSFSQRMCGGNIFYRTFSALTRFLARFSHSLSNSFIIMIVVVAGVDVQRLWYITSDDDDVNGWCGKKWICGSISKRVSLSIDLSIHNNKERKTRGSTHDFFLQKSK